MNDAARLRQSDDNDLGGITQATSIPSPGSDLLGLSLIGGVPWLVRRLGREPGARTAVSIAALGWFAISVVLIGAGEVVQALLDGGGRRSPLAMWFAENGNGVLDMVALVGSSVADTKTVLGAGLASVLVLLAAGYRRRVLVVGFGLLLQMACYLTITALVDRPRPDVPGNEPLPPTMSFPSGHVAMTIVLWGGLALVVLSMAPSLRLRAVAHAVLVIAVVLSGFSRLYDGAHDVVEVLVGIAFGWAVLALTVTVVRSFGAELGRSRSVEPLPPPAELAASESAATAGAARRSSARFHEGRQQ